MSWAKITDINRDDLTTRLAGEMEHPPFMQERDFLKWAQQIPRYAQDDILIAESVKRRFTHCAEGVLKDIYRSNKLQMPVTALADRDVSFSDDTLKFQYGCSVKLSFSFGIPPVLYAKAVINTASPYLVDLAMEINDKVNPSADGLKVPLIGKESRGNLSVVAFHHVWEIDRRMGEVRTLLERDHYYPKVKELEKALSDSPNPSERAKEALQEDYSGLVKEIAALANYQSIFKFGDKDKAPANH